MAAGPKNTYADKLIAAAERGREQGYQPIPVDLGMCECPGKPHEKDEAIVKDRFTWAESSRVLSAAQRGEHGEGEMELVFQALVSWNLTTRSPEGEDNPLPILRLTVQRLSPRQGLLLKTSLDQPHYLFGGPVPNAQGEPSPDGLAGST